MVPMCMMSDVTWYPFGWTLIIQFIISGELQKKTFGSIHPKTKLNSFNQFNSSIFYARKIVLCVENGATHRPKSEFHNIFQYSDDGRRRTKPNWTFFGFKKIEWYASGVDAKWYAIIINKNNHNNKKMRVRWHCTDSIVPLHQLWAAFAHTAFVYTDESSVKTLAQANMHFFSQRVTKLNKENAEDRMNKIEHHKRRLRFVTIAFDRVIIIVMMILRGDQVVVYDLS